MTRNNLKSIFIYPNSGWVRMLETSFLNTIEKVDFSK